MNTEGWQPAFLCRCKTGSFVVAESLEDAEEMASDLTGEYNAIEFNFNRGQPRIRLQDGSEVSIVDVDMKSR